MTKQAPLKKTLVFLFLGFLREIATTVFRKKYQIKSYKNKQAELLYEHKDFSLFCFLMKKSPKEISVFLTAQNLFQNLIEPFFRKFFVKRCMSAFLQYLQTIRNTQTVQRIDDAL